MDKINFKKVSVLPSKPEKNTLYFVENGNYAEIYLTSSTGIYKKVGNSAMINEVSEVITLSGIPSGSIGLNELSSIVNTYLIHGETAFGWSDHSTFGYLTSFTETDPIFTAWDRSTGINILAAQVSDFDTEVSNNPSVVANTAKVSFPGFTSLLADYGFADNSANWDTAFGWGDWSIGVNKAFVDGLNVDADTLDGINSTGFSLAGHTHAFAEITAKPTTIAGYGITDAYTDTEIDQFFSSTTPITGYNKTNWDTAYGWGDHALGGYFLTSDTKSFKETVSTGIVSGGALSINVDNTKFDIAAGIGYIVDNTVYPAIVTEVNFGPFTAQTLTNLATSFATDIAIDVNGNIIQQDSFTDSERRSLIFLGGFDHSNQTNILSAFSIQVPINSPANSISELARAVGDINIFGNVYGPNGANLNIDKSGGLVFSYGRNNVNDKSDPHKITESPQVVVSFGYVFNDGSGNGSFTIPGTSINPNNYDLGTGALGAVPVNDWSIQRILFFPNDDKTFVQYGTATYNKKEDALNAVPRADFPALSGIATAMVRGYLIVRQGETDLTSTNTVFLSADKFGNVAGLDGGGSLVAWGNIIGNLPDQLDLQNAFDLKEDAFSKNTAFNKNFGTIAGTVTEGNDTRILNGQIAYSWGNHALVGYELMSNKGAANGYAPLGADSKLPTAYLPNLAITSVISAAETTLSAFAVASGSYTFEEGDVIVITTIGGDTEHYMYDGGTKTLTASYSLINNTQIDWSQIVSIPTTISGFGITDAYTKTESDNLFAEVATPNSFTAVNTFEDIVKADKGLHLLPGIVTTTPSRQTIGFDASNRVYFTKIGTTANASLDYTGITGSRTYTLQDANGILAFTSDIPTNVSELTNDSGYITSFDITTQTDSKYLRSDIDDTKDGGSLRFNDNLAIRFGTTTDANLYSDGSALVLQLAVGSGDFKIKNDVLDRFTFGKTTGNFTATGSGYFKDELTHGFTNTSTSGIIQRTISANPILEFQRWSGVSNSFRGNRFYKDASDDFYLQFATNNPTASQVWNTYFTWSNGGNFTATGQGKFGSGSTYALELESTGGSRGIKLLSSDGITRAAIDWNNAQYLIRDSSDSPMQVINYATKQVNFYGNLINTGTITSQGTGDSSFGGKVGFGITSPVGIVHIDGASDSLSGIMLDATSASDNRLLDIRNTVASFRLGLEYDNANINLNIVDRNRAKLVTFREGGNVGIGITSPAYKLDVSGTGRFTGDVIVPDEAYGAGWNGSTEVPTKNAVYDQIRPYKTYVALVSQGGTGVPTATVLENNTGATFTFARSAAGVYTITASSAVLTASKTTVCLQSTVNVVDGTPAVANIRPGTSTVVNFWTSDSDNVGVTYNDDCLSNSMLEIRIYP